ncbi:hypothetical protein CCHR01_02456 [Colletotrichum chrysophilum]|uniref:Uncharacterized protein n=1 Tax=Colletotrichum chrysophilum TaxID=1836956 RepID=A0AAD9AUQ0_9PEZI|nr:hypothetical protein CCHR01_02456 [Colletotrichum chrysophilum]
MTGDRRQMTRACQCRPIPQAVMRCISSPLSFCLCVSQRPSASSHLCEMCQI